MRLGVATLILAALAARPLCAEPTQTFSAALGLPLLELDWRARVTDRFALGAEISWEELDTDETISVSVLGLGVPLALRVPLGSAGLELAAAPGAARLSGRFRLVASGGLMDSAPDYSLRVPLSATFRWPLTARSRLWLTASLLPDWVVSGGLVLSPSAAVALETDIGSAASIGLELRAGRVFVVSGEPGVFQGHRAVTMPLALVLTFTWRA